MANYSLTDTYSDRDKDVYSLDDLEAYWYRMHNGTLEEAMKQNVQAVHKKVRLFFQEQLTCPFYPIRNTEPREKAFAYLQLLYYIMEVAAKRGYKIRQFLNLIQQPSQEQISLYNEILRGLEGMITKRPGNHPMDIVNRADAVWTSYEYISLIAYCLHNDYVYTPEELHGNLETFLQEVPEDGPLQEISQEPEESYFDLFYRIVACARVSAEVSDLLGAFKTVKDHFSVGHTPKGIYANMLSEDCRKVEERDQVTLAYQNGKIVEATVEQTDLLLAPLPNDEEYTDALEQYIRKNLQELTRKVFCCDEISRENADRLKTHISRVKGFWCFERDRYQDHNAVQEENKIPFEENHYALSKAKLISLYQVIFLSEPKAGLTAGRDHRTMTRADRSPVPSSREQKSYSSVFLETPGTPTYRDSYSQQEMCIWVDYQTLFNVSSPQFADAFLNVNIHALTVILQKKSAPERVQRTAEQMLRHAVRSLIRPENDSVEIRMLFQRLWETEGASCYVSQAFRAKAKRGRLGAYLRLLSVAYVQKQISAALHREGNRCCADVALVPYDFKIMELPPITLHLSWEHFKGKLLLDFKDLSNI